MAQKWAERKIRRFANMGSLSIGPMPTSAKAIYCVLQLKRGAVVELKPSRNEQEIGNSFWWSTFRINVGEEDEDGAEYH
jgi:hypothetical protein